MTMLNSLRSLIYLFAVDPGLAKLVWSIKRDKKTYLGYLEIASLVRNFLVVRSRCRHNFCVAEFGVGRGGSAMILAKLISIYGGYLVLYDLFGRIPPPTVHDGEKAHRRYQSILSEEDENYYGNIHDLMKLIASELGKICDLTNVKFVVGRFEEVLPYHHTDCSFGLVHIDCDWYESYKAVLTYLEHRLCPGAILQLDDYYSWEGVPKAVAEAAWLASYRKRRVGTALVIDTAH